MNAFFETASKLIRLTPETRTALSLILHPMELPKGHILVKENSICNYLWFIEKGLTRTYYNKEGKDVTDWISTENNYCCSIISFITRRPDRRGIELLEDSILWSMHYNDLEKLYESSHQVERFGRLLLSQGLIQVQQRFDDLHFATAAERYQKMILEHPSIIQRVPLGMIASYLGITQETLSRIRAQSAHP
ncbi:MAG TPA: Crp/Fnr family transcriptional regulator [Flavitalea sp.]|nr:Crp/Fnr family transcriptional regulator [Flavitalea sp.]